ncbi:MULTISPECIES: helix-turn-helix domain-containing protein [unclassified Brevibacterium]|uniref:PucR family transcriptional regulator n=1 Tax=unclassified Brevibacterium TaxID=2614124 RepID=UPI001E497007|nr:MULTISPECIES: helix-turn-helix domain-containing protein [unclassified Brevibacterium]MCD1286094.1 hypothetical protein [Brevibacterium sp. CCUG 69071]MDK8433445.1 helix-turn-helix domain-containing protein [Brevibacterium sp. H-BE7]
MNSREQVFEALLSSLGADDPLGSVIKQASRITRGSALIVNELGEVLRAVGVAPPQLISQWVVSDAFARPGATDSQADDHHSSSDVRQSQIGRWIVVGVPVRIRRRMHAIVVALHEDSDPIRDLRFGGKLSEVEGSAAMLVLDTAVKILRAFEGFESFSISTRREESARLMRELQAGVAPGREPATWRTLENFGIPAYSPVRAIRARLPLMSAETAPQESVLRAASSEPSRAAMNGIVLSDSGMNSTTDEVTALCVSDFPIEEFLAEGVTAVGISESFTALGQVPEMLRSADVAAAAAKPGEIVHVEQMRPVEWAAARLNSRFDRQIARRYVERLNVGNDAWPTLKTYIECSGNIADTARRLNVHENTVRYRLGQIEGQLGARLTDPRIVADVVVALECQRRGQRG